jgi:diguanylate cyclase (GGDEF)-like protein/PAS domain S-box-containing protein
VAVAGVGVADSRRAQARSEQRRIDERLDLLDGVSAITATTIDPAAHIDALSTLPWGSASPSLLDFATGEIASIPSLGTHGMAAVLDRSGAVLSVAPTGTAVAIDVDDPRFARALGGRAYTPELTWDGEHHRTYMVMPALGPDGEVEVVVVVGLSTVASDWSAIQAGLGALGSGSGGSSRVDSTGRAEASWDPDLVGQVIVDPALLAAAGGPGGVAVHRHRVDGEDVVTLVKRMSLDNTQRYTIWQQSAEDLFGDLRAGQAARDAAVSGLLVVVVLALALVNRRRELALRRNAARLDALLRQAHDLILVVDARGEVRFASAAVEPLFGRRSDEVVGRPLTELLGDEPVRCLLEAAAADDGPRGRRGTTLRDLSVVGPHGEQCLFDIDGVDLRHRKEVGGYLLTCHEISERVGLQDRLSAQASHDPLTGLANRAQFNRRLDDLADERLRATGNHAVVFVDLDHFKPVNDRFGHQAGDELLKVIAGRLSAVVRATDVVCRLGGDEFAILLADCDQEQARVKAQALLDAVRQPVAVADELVTVDASIGVAVSRPSITHPEQLVREADQAMYRAKRAGRGQFVVDA